MKKLIIIFLIIICISVGAYLVYSKVNGEQEEQKIRVSVLKGPTGIGMAKLMRDNDNGTSKNKYDFSIVGAPEQIVAKISSGEVDIAAIPGNLAATLYNKTEGDIVIGGVNTLGVLYILDNTQQIKKIEDLKGKNIYATGQGAVAEFALQFILEANGITIGKDVTITYLKEHSELVALAIAGEVSICMLPEPFVTTLLMKEEHFKIVLDLTKEWEAAAKKIYNEEIYLTMGAIIARREFVENNKKEFDNFLEEYEDSTKYTNSNIEETAKLVSEYDIIANEEIVKSAIPNCNIVLIRNEDMRKHLSKFYETFFKLEPKSIGGKVPDEEIYYIQ